MTDGLSETGISKDGLVYCACPRCRKHPRVKSVRKRYLRHFNKKVKCYGAYAFGDFAYLVFAEHDPQVDTATPLIVYALGLVTESGLAGPHGEYHGFN